MTNNIKYRKPIPIKAQSGRSLEARQDNTRVYRPEIRQKMKAPEGYSPLLTSIDNQNQKATMPLSIALGEGAISGSRVGPIGAAIGMGAALLDHYIPRAKGQAAMIRSVQTPRSRVMDRAETAPTDTISPNPASATQEAQETNPGTNNTDNKDNKDNKDKKSFRDRLADKVADKIRGNSGKKESAIEKESKTMWKNIANIYKLAGKTLGYGVALSPLAGAGYGTYQIFKPEQTTADSLINAKIKELEELNKLDQAMQYNNKINEIMQKLTSKNGTTQNDSINFPTQEQQITNLDAIADSIKAASQRQKSGQTQIYN